MEVHLKIALGFENDTLSDGRGSETEYSIKAKGDEPSIQCLPPIRL